MILGGWCQPTPAPGLRAAKRKWATLGSKPPIQKVLQLETSWELYTNFIIKNKKLNPLAKRSFDYKVSSREVLIEYYGFEPTCDLEGKRNETQIFERRATVASIDIDRRLLLLSRPLIALSGGT